MGFQVVNGKPDDSACGEYAGQILCDLDKNGVFGVAIRGGAGCGKTTLISAAVNTLGPSTNCAVVCCDSVGSFDAEKFSKLGIPVVQVNTQGEQFIPANLLLEALKFMDLSRVDLLFVEDCGNVSLDASKPLGIHRVVACVSSCQGEFAISKYSRQFADSDVNIITKADLAKAVGFSAPLAVSSLKQINSKAGVIVTSAKEGDGINTYCQCLLKEMAKETCGI